MPHGATVGLEAGIDTQGTLVLKNLWGPMGQIIDLINLKKMSFNAKRTLKKSKRDMFFVSP